MVLLGNVRTKKGGERGDRGEDRGQSLVGGNRLTTRKYIRVELDDFPT